MITHPDADDASSDRRKQTPRPMVMHARVVTGTGGGPDKTILNSPRFLSQLGYDCVCAFLRPTGDDDFAALRARAHDWGAPLVEVDDRGKLDPAAIRRLVRLCRDHQVTIWHAHDYKTNLIGLIARRFHPMYLVTTAHGWVNFAGHTPLYYWLDKRWWLRRYDRVICVSDTVRDECLVAGVPEGKCVVIENAIDQDQFCRTRPITQAKRQQWDAGPERLVIGALGRLANEKGFDHLINALVEVVDAGIDAQLVIAGEGPDETELRRLAAVSKYPERVAFVGFCRDTRGFLESLDLFVLSSLREGLPNVVLEAMAVGVPVVATDVGGVSRVVRDGENGLLVPSGSLAAIRDGILRLAERPPTRAAFAAAGLKTINESWSFRRRMQRVDQIYHDVMNERGL